MMTVMPNRMSLHRSSAVRLIDYFIPNLAPESYPGFRSHQLEPGAFRGWVFRLPLNTLTLNAGCFNRAILSDGVYEKDIVDIGFILDAGPSVTIHAHGYDAGGVGINTAGVPAHEIFPGNMSWVGIQGSGADLFGKHSPWLEIMRRRPHQLLSGLRDQLEPLVRCVRDCLHRDPGMTPVNRAQLEKQILEHVRNLLDQRLPTSAGPSLYEEGDKFRMRVVDQSERLLRAAGSRPIRLVELCEATGMKSRTLQKYFHELYGMGPTTYFRVRRLNAARTDLLRGTPQSVDVGWIAAKRGFHHQGRFAASYRQMFNEPPSATLAFRSSSASFSST